MRLGQIARKLEITTQDLAGYLESRFGRHDWGTNSRLTEDQLAEAIRHFAPHQAITFFETKKDAIEPEPAAALPASAVETSGFTPPTDQQPSPALPPAAQPETIELIKAPKVELSGLKVLGKIELPEKKKKESSLPNETREGGTTSPAGTRPQRTGKRLPSEDNRPRKNPVALQREREERELLKQKQEQARQVKEKKANRYFKSIEQKQVKVVRNPRLVSEELEEFTPEETKPAPTTWWGKLVHWFNS